MDMAVPLRRAWSRQEKEEAMLALGRRAFVGGTLAMLAAGRAGAIELETGGMYGMIGKMRTVPGQRDAFIAILQEGTGGMPGCLSYIFARDPNDADAIWITEVWESRESHRASLQLPQVRATIARGRPLIAGFDSSVETEPVGGIGLTPRAAAA